MIESLFEPDVFRLGVLVLLGFAAYRDLETRRVPNWIWVTIAGAAVVLLAWDAAKYLDWTAALRLLFLKTVLSIVFVGGMGFLFWYIGAFGGADAKAFMALSLFFPEFPVYHINGWILPLTESNVGVFSLTILTNTVLLALFIPIGIGLRNILHGKVNKASIFSFPVAVTEFRRHHGAILAQNPVTNTPALSKRADIDVIESFLDWRNMTLNEFLQTTTEPDTKTITRTLSNKSYNPELDPYGVTAFYEESDAPKYGTSKTELLAVMHTLSRTDPEENVWISPGLPFITILFFGTIFALIFGDVLYYVISGFV